VRGGAELGVRRIHLVRRIVQQPQERRRFREVALERAPSIFLAHDPPLGAWTTNFDPLVADACAKIDGTGHLQGLLRFYREGHYLQRRL
jgi:hypothetical protein